MSKSKGRFSSITQTIKFITGILSWIILIILVIIAAFLLYYFVSTKVYAQKGEAYKPAFSLYTILTQSMQPNINPYDVIVDVAVKNPEDIQVGDIITFVSTSSLTKGMTITHRVYDIKQENGEYVYYTKGDDNLSPDALPAPYSNVLGKVLFHIPQLGRIQSFLSTKGGWLIVVVVPAVIIIILDILKIFRLQTAKNQVDVALTMEKDKKLKEEKRKKEIERNLERRYNLLLDEDEKKSEQEKIYNKEKEVAEKLKELEKEIQEEIEQPKKETEKPKVVTKSNDKAIEEKQTSKSPKKPNSSKKKNKSNSVSQEIKDFDLPKLKKNSRSNK